MQHHLKNFYTKLAFKKFVKMSQLILQFRILKKYDNLKFSDTVSINIKEKIINPKRLQREISKTIKKGKISTKSQEILKSEHEKNKIEKKKNNRKQREAEKKRKFQIKQQKKTEKHKGR